MPALTKDHSPVRRRSAGVVVVRRHAERSPRHATRWRCLVLRAFAYWDFPKGSLEPGEAPLAAAIREVEEETGLVGLVFHWGEAFRETAPYAGGKVARYYLAESPAGEVRLAVNPALGRPEHHAFRWVTFGEATRLFVPRVQEIAGWAEALLASSP